MVNNMNLFNFGKKQEFATKNALNNAITYINNSLSGVRKQLGVSLGMSHDGKRDIYEVYGYPQAELIPFNTLYWMSKRQGIANRITHGMAKSCWRNGIEIESNDEPILQDELKILSKSGMFKRFESADILNRIGSFSALFIGVPDGLAASEPLGVVKSAVGLESVYFKAYAYDGITIHQQELDPANPRYGLPELYSVQRIGRGDTQKDTDAASIIVHHSRIIIMNEGMLDSSIEGVSAIEGVYNNLLDIQKATGGAAEAYFRNARGKISFEIDKEFASNALFEDGAIQDSVKEKAQAFTNNWEDQIIAAGSKVKTHTTEHYSPLDTVKVSLWVISSQTGLPIRILTGEGAGQLAGSEDKLTYNSIVSDRQNIECTPWVDQLLTILSTSNLIDLPDDYKLIWPLEDAHSEKEDSEINKTNSETVKILSDAASTPGGDSINLEETLSAMGLNDVKFNNIHDDFGE